MKTEEIDILKKIITFDYFNLYDKEDFLNWIERNEDQVSFDLYKFGNLNKSVNREKLYNETLLELDLDFDKKSSENIINIKRVLKEYCLKYLQESFSEEELQKAITFLYGNCVLEVFNELGSNTAKIFWELHELTEREPTELKNFKNQIINNCKTLIPEIEKE